MRNPKKAPSGRGLGCGFLKSAPLERARMRNAKSAPLERGSIEFLKSALWKGLGRGIPKKRLSGKGSDAENC